MGNCNRHHASQVNTLATVKNSYLHDHTCSETCYCISVTITKRQQDYPDETPMLRNTIAELTNPNSIHANKRFMWDVFSISLD